MGSFNALVFIKKTKMIESFSDMSLPIQKKQKKKKSSKENICICILIFGNFSYFSKFWFFFVSSYTKKILNGAFSMHTFL